MIACRNRTPHPKTGSAICRNGDKVCPGEVIASATTDPMDCARSTDFTDGYSTSFLFGGVRAILTGFSGR